MSKAITSAFILKLWSALGYSRNNPNSGVLIEGMEFPMGIKERVCWNSRRQLKKKLNFQQWSRKTNVEFPSVLSFRLGIFKGFHTTLWTWIFSLEFPRVKWQIQNFQTFFPKSISSTSPPPSPRLHFSRIAHLKARVCICSEISFGTWNLLFC